MRSLITAVNEWRMKFWLANNMASCKSVVKSLNITVKKFVPIPYLSIMELLLSFGVSTELQKDEFDGKLKCGCSADQVNCALRDYLFEDALKLNLASDGDCLVMRRKSYSMSVKDKHAEDIWMLVEMIQRHENLPRTILKNGKRSRGKFIRSRTKERDHSRKESGGNTDVGGASRREHDALVRSRVSGEAVNVQIGGVESAGSGSLLGRGGDM